MTFYSFKIHVDFIIIFLGKISIPISDVVSVSYPKKKSSSTPITPSLTPQHTQPVPISNGSPTQPSNEIEDFRCFTINYAKRSIDPKVQDVGAKSKSSSKNSNIWRIYSITLHNNDKSIIKEWHDSLAKILKCELTYHTRRIVYLLFDLILLLFI